MLVNVHKLIDRPGQSEDLARSVDPADLVPTGEDDVRWDPPGGVIDGDLDLDLRLSSVVDGILVRGTVDVDLVMPCSRCLAEITDEATLALTELFHDPRKLEVEDYTEGDDYLVESDLIHIDLGRALRDAITLAVPSRPLCRPDCAGLCPTCGIDRNVEDCGHGNEAEADPRWAALADLELDLHDDVGSDDQPDDADRQSDDADRQSDDAGRPATTPHPTAPRPTSEESHGG
ncbi:MAG TPA: DUF177 domain-containing protein [Nitriliruptoraceae bacterium]|nr:DUF177 domain-containing protein [Nitriliruptoraceae bacterium]